MRRDLTRARARITDLTCACDPTSKLDVIVPSFVAGEVRLPAWSLEPLALANLTLEISARMVS